MYTTFPPKNKSNDFYTNTLPLAASLPPSLTKEALEMRMIAVESRSRSWRERESAESGDPANSVWAIEEGKEKRRPLSLSLSPLFKGPPPPLRLSPVPALLRQRFLLMSMGRKDGRRRRRSPSDLSRSFIRPYGYGAPRRTENGKRRRWRR